MSARVGIGEQGIVLLDFSGIREPDRELHQVEAARKLIAKQPRGQALVLTDVTGSSFTPASVEALDKLMRHNKPYVKASAVVGLSPITTLVFRTLLALTGRDVRPFASRAEAIDYLLAHRRTSDLPLLIPDEE